MKSRTEILVPIAAIQAVPIAVIAWYRLHRYAWYRYSAIVTAKTESDELKKNTAETIGQIKEEVGKAIAEKSSEFNDKCNDYLSQLEKIKDAFSVIQKLFSKNVDENPDSGDGQETR